MHHSLAGLKGAAGSHLGSALWQSFAVRWKIGARDQVCLIVSARRQPLEHLKLGLLTNICPES